MCGSKIADGFDFCFSPGNKVNNVDVVYTPWFNLKKTPSMEVGQVGFHNSKMVMISYYFFLNKGWYLHGSLKLQGLLFLCRLSAVFLNAAAWTACAGMQCPSACILKSAF